MKAYDELLKLLAQNEMDWGSALSIQSRRVIELEELLKKKGQSRKESIREVVVGQVVGFVISVCIMYWLLGADGIDAGDAPWATLIFAVTSFIRSWCVRLLFNWYDRKYG